MAIQVNLGQETERVLQEKAARTGITLEAYLELIAEREACSDEAGQASTEVNDFERNLDELSEGLPSLPTLPADFSRVDIYSEHA